MGDVAAALLLVIIQSMRWMPFDREVSHSNEQIIRALATGSKMRKLCICGSGFHVVIIETFAEGSFLCLPVLGTWAYDLGKRYFKDSSPKKKFLVTIKILVRCSFLSFLVYEIQAYDLENCHKRIFQLWQFFRNKRRYSQVDFNSANQQLNLKRE